MKKLIALGLAACMTFSLAGCSGSTSKETEAASAAETTAAASTEAETSAAASDTATSIDKLTVTYVTSPLNVPTIIEKDQESSRKSSAFRLSMQSLLPVLTRHRLLLPAMFRFFTQ